MLDVRGQVKACDGSCSSGGCNYTPYDFGSSVASDTVARIGAGALGMGERSRRLSHKQLESAAKAALLGWIGDAGTGYREIRPQVLRLIEALRPLAETVVSPVGEFLPDHVSVTAFLADCLGIVGFYSDGSRWPDVCADWPLSEPQRAELPEVRQRMRLVLGMAAEALAEEGLPLDPLAAVNQLALGQLLLTEALQVGTARELVDCLHVVAAGGFDEQGRTQVPSDHLSEEDERLLVQLRRAFREQMGYPHIAAPYAGGRRRAPIERVQKRREALLAVHREFPRVTAAKISQTWFARAGPGGRLRELLGSQTSRPSESTLRNDMRELGIRPQKRS